MLPIRVGLGPKVFKHRSFQLTFFDPLLGKVMKNWETGQFVAKIPQKIGFRQILSIQKVSFGKLNRQNPIQRQLVPARSAGHLKIPSFF